jgi:hypothetical protein
MQLLPWLLTLIVGAVAIYAFTSGSFTGGGRVDARGTPDPDRSRPPDDSGDALSRSLGDIVASGFKFASLYAKQS